jgi:hypothetical protein
VKIRKKYIKEHGNARKTQKGGEMSVGIAQSVQCLGYGLD